jgi:hypothetical protein
MTKKTSRVVPPLTFRITLYHDYTPNPANYKAGATVEDMLKADGGIDTIQDVMEAVLETGDVGWKIEVIHDGKSPRSQLQ